MQGDFICLGPGAIPMPVALPNAKCGPQVVGTGRPANMGDLASLNPCPSKDECVSFRSFVRSLILVFVFLLSGIFNVDISSWPC